MEREVDLIIVGGGPAGLCAAITATSEGVKTVLVDSKAGLGGQAKDSSLVENYPGFPEGISGRDLTGKFVQQAARFGTELLAPCRARTLVADEDRRIITTDDNETLIAPTVILASGLSYNRLHAQNCGQFVGRGVSYGAPTGDNGKKHYCVIGGANSAGQAAVHLAQTNPAAGVPE